MLSLLIVFAPCAVMAQEPATSAERLQADLQGPYAVVSDPSVPDSPRSKADEQQPPPAQPPPAPAVRRRRGSMVGYVEDAIIGSKVRFRFDAGFQNTVPDRAEFFYAKCGCYGGDAQGPRPGASTNLDFRQLHVLGEYAVNDRFSVFADVPVRWIDTEPEDFIFNSLAGGVPFPDQSGFGDVRAGVKVGLAVNDDQSLTLQTQLYTPTGDSLKGLGTDHASLEPALLYHRRASDVVLIESQVGVWVPLGGGSAEPPARGGDFSGTVLFYGIGPSFELYQRGRVQFAPVVELVGWRVASGFQTVPGLNPDDVDPRPADGTNIVNLKIGARINVDRGSFYIGYGHALTDATWYEDIVRFEYRFLF